MDGECRVGMNIVCPLCNRSVKTRLASDGNLLLPNHGHRITRGMHTGGTCCKASGFSVRGLEIVSTWTAAFGLLKGR